jgi:hypothetical protein
MAHIRTFIVDYQALDVHGRVIKTGKARCKNKLSKFDAMAGLENHLKKQDPQIKSIKVLSCRSEDILGLAEDLQDILNIIR